MRDKIAAIIPALDSNRYYPEGDLVLFGDTTLLEWKISQISGLIDRENIYIATPSEKIIELAQGCGVKTVKRSQNTQSMEWIKECVEPVKEEIILWAYVTSPFVSEGDYRQMLETFFDLPKSYDSLIAVYKEQEYILFQNAPLNFDINQYDVRKNLDPIYRITNGCYIAHKESYQQNHKYFGHSPYYYEVDRLTSLEIKDINDYAMALNLLSLYFKAKEI